MSTKQCPRCHDEIHPRSRWYRGENRRTVEVRMNPPELDANTVDEICTEEIHLEHMDDNAYWMNINGVAFWFHARGKITLTHENETAKAFTRPHWPECPKRARRTPAAAGGDLEG